MHTEVSSVRVAKISLDDFFKSNLGINLILNISLPLDFGCRLLKNE